MLKTIGLLGGMSWESSVHYYRIINERVREVRGGLHSAPILLHSFDFAAIREMQQAGNWDEATAVFVAAAQGLERAGAECLAICTNTMHLIADAVQREISIPLIHIADAAGNALQKAEIRSAFLLGTRYTMQMPFLRDHLERDYALEISVPTLDRQEWVDALIFEELCQGVLREASRQELVTLIEASGAEAVLLGCTELMLLLREGDCTAKVFDTTELHALSIADFALGLTTPSALLLLELAA